jgi:hypothetical protein
MADRDRDRDDDIYLEHPNRDKASSKLARLVVIVLLITSAVLLVVLSVGGWERMAGAKSLQIFYVVLYLVLAVMVARWSRGVLPLAAAQAIILAIFAAVSAPGWYSRANEGFAETALGAELLGFLCFVLAAVQLALIVAAMVGFGQAWHVEVERSRDEDRRNRGFGGRSGAVAAPA